MDKFHKDQQSMSMNNGTSVAPVVEVQAVSQWSACQTKHLRHVQHQGGGGEGGGGGWPKLNNPTYELGFHCCQSKVQATPKVICVYVWNYPEWLAFSTRLKNVVEVARGEVQFSCFFYTNPVLGSCGETLDLSQDVKSRRGSLDSIKGYQQLIWNILFCEKKNKKNTFYDHFYQGC